MQLINRQVAPLGQLPNWCTFGQKDGDEGLADQENPDDEREPLEMITAEVSGDCAYAKPEKTRGPDARNSTPHESREPPIRNRDRKEALNDEQQRRQRSASETRTMKHDEHYSEPGGSGYSHTADSVQQNTHARSIPHKLYVEKLFVTWVHVARDVELDVGIERMPDRAVLLVRQRSGPVYRFFRNSSGDVEPQVDFHETMGILLRALTDNVSFQPLQRMTSFSQDVDDVRGHAAGKGEDESLDRRRTRRTVAIDRDAGLSWGAAA